MNTVKTRKITIPVKAASGKDWWMPITYYVRGEWDCECGHHITYTPGEMLGLQLGRCQKCGRKIEKVEEVK